MRCPRILHTLTVVTLTLTANSAPAATWVIQPDGTGDAPTIQAGVNLATSGDSLLLAPGTFTGPGNRDVLFQGKDLVVTSQAGAAATTIDCESSGRAFLFIQNETSAAVLEDLTITNGAPNAAGGAVLSSGASPTIQRCVLAHNVGVGGIGAGGGAIYCGNGSGVTIDGCHFEHNSVAGPDGLGGAVSFDNSSGTVSNCTFENNETETTQFAGGGGLSVWFGGVVTVSGCTFLNNTSTVGGGAVLLQTSQISVSDCQFLDNKATGQGGGLGTSGPSILVADCDFSRNEAPTGGGATGIGTYVRCAFDSNQATVRGGGFFTSGDASTLEECVLLDNHAAQRGGGAMVLNGTLEIESSTLVRNSSPVGGNVCARSTGVPTSANVSHTILAFGIGPGLTCLSASATAECSDVFGNTGGDWVDCLSGQENQDGNFWADPRFCDLDAGDLTIRADSPCAPPGITGCGLVGALPVECGPVSVTSESWGSVKARFRDGS